MSAMKRDASRRWRLLTLVGAFEGCCDERLVFVVESLRACLALEWVGLDLEDVDGCIVVGLSADLLLDACVCGFAKVTLVEARFRRMRSIVMVVLVLMYD